MTYEMRHVVGAPEDDETYYMWLLDKVGANDIRWTEYTLLLRELMRVDFWYDPKKARGMDRNRAADGLQLRQDYADECYGEVVEMSGECTVLEMMVALACRIEYELASEPGEEEPERWFELFLTNLDLLGYDDDNYDEAMVYSILERWMRRQYDRRGHGGLFPLKARRCPDQRNVEIWCQMQSYIMENFPD